MRVIFNKNQVFIAIALAIRLQTAVLGGMVNISIEAGAPQSACLLLLIPIYDTVPQ